MLVSPERPVSVGRILMALGVLLQPVMSAGSAGMGKGLVLPLPCDPLYRNLVACLWLDLMSGFLGRADFELLMLMRNDGPAMLAIGFKGLKGSNLAAMFDSGTLQDDFIDLCDPDWGDGHTHGGPAPP